MGMVRRLKPMFVVLLALLVGGASSQAAVCELSCGLGAQGVLCHMAAVAQPATMQAMQHGHCASMRSAAETSTAAHVDSVDERGCGYSFSPAVENTGALTTHCLAGCKAFLQTSKFTEVAVRSTDLPLSRPPPLLASANPLLITLRI